MSERGDATSELSVAMAKLAGAIGRRGASIATNGRATRALGLAIERQARAIATKAIAIERRSAAERMYLSVNEGFSEYYVCLLDEVRRLSAFGRRCVRYPL
jgi:hypothetical protein